MGDEFFVVDTSVAVKWYIPEDHSDLALLLLRKLEKPNVNFYAPSLFKVEFLNAIRKYLIRKLINEDVAREIIGEIQKLPITYVDITWERVNKAFLYSIKKNLTLYDSLYIIIAKEIGGVFITADKRVVNATTGDKSVVSLIDVESYVK